MAKKVSIVIPIYNVEKYLSQCLDSLLEQTLEDIEIVCVEDASTDSSRAILMDYEKKHQRIHAIYHEQNKGTSVSRKEAVELAQGKYMMFVDSDDYLDKNACDILYHLMEEKQVDILQFGTELLVENNVSCEMQEWVENFLASQEMELQNANLVRECFCKEIFNFNITNKVWKSQLCKKSFREIDTGRYVASEDRYSAFILLYYASSFLGIKDKLYYYRLGVGVTGGDILNLERFEKRCSGACTVKGIEKFLKKEHKEEQYREEYETFGNLILWDCIDCWYKKLKPEDKKIGFTILLKYWCADDIISALARMYFEDSEKICRESAIMTENVAVYYRFFGYDKMMPIIEKYIVEYRSKGSTVILLTDEEADETEEGVLNNIKIPVYTLPSATEANWDAYKTRAKALKEFLQEFKITKVCYLSPTSHVRVFDEMLITALNIEVKMCMDEYVVDTLNKARICMDEYEDTLNKVRISHDKVEREMEEQYNELKQNYEDITGRWWYRLMKKLFI